MTRPPPDPAEPTVEDPDQVATVDVLGADAREERDRAMGPEERAELLARITRDSEGDGAAAKVGRYQLLELVGTGGMGMVWGAWDPQLERRVALKLVRRMSHESQQRILKEGQVLARLSHPNVVPIFDVGIAGLQVYLVMEWVRGTTLRAFAADKPGWRPVLEAYRQAGAGLDAAHRAGVIHRDFKPDNAIRGEDGRVRVLDFGLAYALAGEPYRGGEEIVGTPKYRSPEQTKGNAQSALSDQYAFCLSLRESLTRQGEVPAWLGAILDRGTQIDAARRYPTMRELLLALDHDPARRWRRAALGTVVLAAAVGAFAVGNARSAGGGAAIEPCTGAEATLAASWNPDLRDRVAAHLRGLGVLDGAEIDRLGRELDAYAATWVGEQRSTCLASARHEITAPRYEERLRCLDRSRAQLAAVGELLVGVDAKELPATLSAARALPDSASCAAHSGGVAPPPAAMAARVAEVAAQVERAHVLAAARRADCLEVATAVVAEARATGYTPLLARALMVQGRAALQLQEDADEALGEAWRLALLASDDLLAVEAYARAVFARAIQGKPGPGGWDVMVQLSQRLGPTGRFARALLWNNQAIVYVVANDKVTAKILLQRAAREAVGAPEIELDAIQANLSSIERDPVESLRLRRDVLARRVAVLGPTHPETLIQRCAVGTLTRERAAARLDLEASTRGLEQWRLPAAAAMCGLEAAWLADEDGDRAAAASWMERVAAYDGDPVEQQIARAYIALVRGGFGREHVTALQALVAAPQPHWWNRRYAALALVVMALDADDRGERAAAAALWERALTKMLTVEQNVDERYLARMRAVLAERWASSRPAEARALAAAALTWYRGAPGDEAIVARLERIAAVK